MCVHAATGILLCSCMLVIVTVVVIFAKCDSQDIQREQMEEIVCKVRYCLMKDTECYYTFETKVLSHFQLKKLQSTVQCLNQQYINILKSTLS